MSKTVNNVRGWAQNRANLTSSAAVLEPPPGARMDRAAAGLSGNRWASFHIEIEAADETTPYNITLYFLDYDDLHIKQGVKLMRGGSPAPTAGNAAATIYRTIAPMAFVEDFASTGKYVTYTVAGSLRFRFVEVRFVPQFGKSDTLQQMRRDRRHCLNLFTT